MNTFLARSLVLAVCLVCSSPSAFASAHTAENDKVRVTIQVPDTIPLGDRFEVIATYENLTDQTLRLNPHICTPSVFGPLCGRIPWTKGLAPNGGVAVVADYIFDPMVQVGEYTYYVEVKVGKSTLTIPLTVTITP